MPAPLSDRTSLVLLNQLLTTVHGPQWWRLEDETLSLDLGVAFTPLMLAKIRLLKGLLSDARPVEERIADDSSNGVMDLAEVPRIQEDQVLFLAACDVINNQADEPDVLVLPTVLELAYTLYVLHHLPIGFHPDTAVAMLAETVLHHEGIRRPIFPFVADTEFPDASTPEAVSQENALKEAMGLYILEMEAT